MCDCTDKYLDKNSRPGSLDLYQVSAYLVVSLFWGQFHPCNKKTANNICKATRWALCLKNQLNWVALCSLSEYVQTTKNTSPTQLWCLGLFVIQFMLKGDSREGRGEGRLSSSTHAPGVAQHIQHTVLPQLTPVPFLFPPKLFRGFFLFPLNLAVRCLLYLRFMTCTKLITVRS